MIANLLPNEATHSSLDLFEKQPLLITFENAFDQKIGPVYSHNDIMDQRLNLKSPVTIIILLTCKKII